MRVLPLLCALLLAACSSAGVENGALSGMTRYAGDSSIDSMVALENERIDYAPSELAIYQVELLNKRESPVRCEYRARWFDQNGVQVSDAASTWVPIHLPGRSMHPVRVTARSVDAVRCLVEVRRSEG